MAVKSSYGGASFGLSWQSRLGTEGKLRLGTAWPGWVRQAWQRWSRHSVARHGGGVAGMARLGVIWHGPEWQARLGRQGAVS
jgi:hypothetical protein